MIAFDDPEVVRRRAARLSGMLAETDVPVRPMSFPVERVARASRRSLVRWRIAAAIALLLAGVAGVAPVRAWIAGTARAAWLTVTGKRPAPAPDVPARPNAATMGAVSFAAVEPLVIRVATRQTAGGTLALEARDGRTVSAAITGEPDAAELVVLPDGLRIVNRRESSAGYRILVPAGVTRITVQIGRETPRVVPALAAGRFELDLGVRTRPRGPLQQ